MRYEELTSKSKAKVKDVDELIKVSKSDRWKKIRKSLIYTPKEKMIKELGSPVTDYSKLEYEKLSYWNINEFFLDDFSNLKTKKTSN